MVSKKSRNKYIFLHLSKKMFCCKLSQIVHDLDVTETVKLQWKLFAVHSIKISVFNLCHQLFSLPCFLLQGLTTGRVALENILKWAANFCIFYNIVFMKRFIVSHFCVSFWQFAVFVISKKLNHVIVLLMMCLGIRYWSAYILLGS